MASIALWVRLGLWEQMNTVLVQQVRVSEGRQAQPSLAIIDSQSVKLGQKGGKNTVYNCCARIENDDSVRGRCLCE
jgi:transposase